MAGEIESLDYAPLATPEEQKAGFHADPASAVLYPGFQLRHSTERWGGDCWQVARVTYRSSAVDAMYGRAEEVHVYPTHYATRDAALAAATALYAQDGAGDTGRDQVLAQAVAKAQAGGPQIG